MLLKIRNMNLQEEKELRNNLNPYFNEFYKITKVKGGLVHYVYRLKFKKEIVFVKIRKSHFSELPHIKTAPEDIKYEKKALDLFYKIAPEIFPKIINYIDIKNMLILSDIIANKKTLEKELNSYNITASQAYNLGKMLANLHKKLSTIKDNIRDDNDEKFYHTLLHYRLGYHSIKSLNDVIRKLNTLPRQLIIGDLSPKNIGVISKNSFTICDLENVHRGNTISDIGFLGCSLMLHTINNNKLASSLLLNFLKGYQSIIILNANEVTLLKKYILGIALYRLENPVIPYTIRINSSTKRMRVKNIHEIINRKKISFKRLVSVITT